MEVDMLDLCVCARGYGFDSQPAHDISVHEAVHSLLEATFSESNLKCMCMKFHSQGVEQ